MYEGYLIHYNPNHDKKTGRFTYSTGKDLYKSIKRDVVTGKFDPKNYKSNKALREAVDNSKIRNLTQKEQKIRKEYSQQEDEIQLKNKLFNKYLNKQNELQRQYYNEMKKPHMSKEEKYNIYEKALFKAEDAMLNDKLSRYNDFIDKSKIKNISFEDVAKSTLEVDAEKQKIIDSIIGEYSNKAIKTLNNNAKARIYVEQIINEIIEDEEN